MVPYDDQGQIDLNALQNMMDPRVKLIASTHVPTNGGLVNPAAAVGAIVRKSVLERLMPPFLDLRAATWTTMNTFEIRGDARRLENWESYVAGRIGLGVAVDYALGWGLEAIRDRVTHLATVLRAGTACISGVTIHDKGAERCGIVTLTRAGE